MSVIYRTLESNLVPGPVEYGVIRPAGFGPDESLPLLLVLHGANSSAKILEAHEGLHLPRVVIACASTPTRGGHYIDHREGGKWETLISTDFLQHIQDRYNTDPERVAIFGSSMGGYGAMKIAFANPSKFTAVAALEPTLFPRETMAEVPPRNRIGELESLLQTLEREGFEENSIIGRLRKNVVEIQASGLKIFFDCGDDDCFYLQDGVEYLHRVLWDLDVSHEYHLVQDADHVGPKTKMRREAAFRFIGDALTRPMPLDESPLEELAIWIASDRTTQPPVIDYNSPLGAKALRMMIAPLVEAAAEKDPNVSRRFAALP